LRPSEIYRYVDCNQAEENQSPGFVSFLGDLSGPLARKVRDTWAAGADKHAIFTLLRKQTTFPVPTDVQTELATIFAADKEAHWMADKLAKLGPEPLWPAADIKERVTRTRNLGLDPGNYEATLQDPNPGTPTVSGCIDQLTSTELPNAFFFPGRDSRRALIISGVHGDELGGVEVVQKLQALLTAAGKPFFTTILIPILIRRTNKKSRDVPGGLGLNTEKKLVCRKVEPNRNFPLPGEDLKTARGRAPTKNDPELAFRDPCGNIRAPIGDERTSIRMLPETRILIDLIERFQPERLASVHDHSFVQRCHPCFGRDTLCGGEGPGIFVDPRGINPVTRRITDLAKVQADDQLATRMLTKALAKTGLGTFMTSLSPFAGNQALTPLTVRYFSQQRVEGNSLGDWAPVDTVAHRGITTVTIEVPKVGFAAGGRRKVIDLHSDLLQTVFLEL
jgi:hypothetical protein